MHKFGLVMVVIVIGVSFGIFNKARFVVESNTPVENTSQIQQFNTDVPIPVVESDPEYNPTGVGEYLNSKRNGSWVFYHSKNGFTSAKGDYKEGTRVGSWSFYYPSGRLMSEGSFDDEGRKHGQWTTFHESGDKKSSGEYCNGLRIGQWVGYPYAGNSQSYWVGEFKNGKREGEFRWCVDGQVAVIYNYKNDTRVTKTNLTQDIDKLPPTDFKTPETFLPKKPRILWKR